MGQARKRGLNISVGVCALVPALCLALGYFARDAIPTNAPTADTPEKSVKIPDRAISLKAGPWGNMEAVPISIEPPEELLTIGMIENIDPRWHFDGCSFEEIDALFHRAGLTASQESELLDVTKWENANGAIIVPASRELVLGLSPDARKTIYEALLRIPGNNIGRLRCSYPAGSFDKHFEHSGLKSEVLEMVRKLSFKRGKLEFFCDVPVVLQGITAHSEKVKLLKVLLRKPTLLLKLRVSEDSNIEELDNYWARGPRGKDVKVTLTSLSRVCGGARIDVAHLLPPRPSGALMSFPLPSTNPEDLHKDCHWTALNFFRDPPDARYSNKDEVRQAYINDYYPVLSDPRYGDILIIKKPDGSIIHSAVVIADDVVYTKNSNLFRDPFILMRIPDMMTEFRAQVGEDESLSVAFYRNKYL